MSDVSRSKKNFILDENAFNFGHTIIVWYCHVLLTTIHLHLMTDLKALSYKNRVSGTRRFITFSL